MISKLRFSFLAVVMLVLIGFGFQNQANGQVGLNGLFCPGVPDTTGFLEIERTGTPPLAQVPTFSGALIGTVENSGADAVGGLDWQHVDETFSATTAPTNEVGSQLVTWWTQKDGRNTYLQVTNSINRDAYVHVRIFNEDCVEVRDFCDKYTGYDTHEYNFSDLVSNTGNNVADGNLQGVEGWLVVTSVAPGTCEAPNEQAYDHNYLSGQLIIHDSDDYLYGVNTYARQAICFTDPGVEFVNRIPNGSYQNLDPDQFWSAAQGRTDLVDPLTEINPFQVVLPNPYFSQLMAFVISNGPAGGPIGPSYMGGSFTNLNIPNLLGLGGVDGNVSVWETAPFTVQSTDAVEMSYNLQHYSGTNPFCGNWTAVLLIQDNGDTTGTIVDANCYQNAAVLAPGGAILGNAPSGTTGGTGGLCTPLSTTDTSTYDAIFFGSGRSSAQNGETLSRGLTSGQYRVQVVTGTNNTGVLIGNCGGVLNPVAALVNGFEFIGSDPDNDVCLGPLDGTDNAMLDVILPDFFYAQFNVLPGNDTAGADVVHINFYDDYGPPYEPIAARSSYFVSIFDEHEVPQSCGATDACFVRLGIDDPIVPSEQFNPATPTPSPTAPPTSAPPTTVPPPTLVPTPTPGGGGGSGSCAIAGSPVQLGTALANVLIPLVPVAFAFGVRAARRRKK